jgi:hypothetical protein
MSENSNENRKTNPGPNGSGTKGTGPENPDENSDKKIVHRKTAPHLVERVTALRGRAISRQVTARSVLRRQSHEDIYGKDPEIPYVKFEAAARALVCSLMERQDRMNEEIFYRINDLGYRIEDLEQDRQEGRTGS